MMERERIYVADYQSHFVKIYFLRWHDLMMDGVIARKKKKKKSERKLAQLRLLCVAKKLLLRGIFEMPRIREKVTFSIWI